MKSSKEVGKNKPSATFTGNREWNNKIKTILTYISVTGDLGWRKKIPGHISDLGYDFTLGKCISLYNQS